MKNGISQLLSREFKSLRVALNALNGTLQRFVSTNGVALSGGVGHRRRKVHFSKKARAALVLQGRYMGYIRQLKPRQKVEVRKLREAKGVRAAITLARRRAA